MLAYVFWHWPEPSVSRDAYEAALVRFHRALAEARLPGVRDSVACRVEGAPWLPDGGAGYEDWYRVEGFADLEMLNEGAVTARSREPHDAVARLAAGGTAGLYRLAGGDPGSPASPHATWLAKPAGTSYAAFFATLAGWTAEPGWSLWQRQMTLGPTPEFCLLGPAPADVAVSGPAAPVRVRRHVLWPSARL